jgi:plastocyanin
MELPGTGYLYNLTLISVTFAGFAALITRIFCKIARITRPPPGFVSVNPRLKREGRRAHYRSQFGATRMKNILSLSGLNRPKITKLLLALAAFACGGAVAISAWAVGPTLSIAVAPNGTFTFSPRTVSAGVNTLVTWTNNGGLHTVTSDEGLFDSGNLGATFTFNFTKPGTYNYHCIYHVAQGMVGTITIPGSAHDFSGDNLSDILWRDTNGNAAMWFMNGATVSSSALVANVPTSWSIIGQRDFNGDTNYDILWRDTSGNVAIWLMNGGTVSSSAFIGNVPTVWTGVGTGDFNGDGMGDILWRDTSGNVAMWFMNGATVSSSALVANVPTSWSVVGTADFNGDGKSDILWRDNNGNVAIWLMNGATVSSSVFVGNVPTTWSVVGTADFNGDGKSDILWQDNNGNVAIWFMNGGTVFASSSIGNVPTVWSVAETGDFNGDGIGDILWHDTSGNIALWFMSNGIVASTSFVGNVVTSWSIQGANVD